MEVGSIEYIATINTSDYKRGSQTIQNENAKMEGSTEKTSSRMTGALGKVGKIGFAALATAAVAATAVVVKNIDNAVKRIDTLVAFPRVLQAMGVGADEAEAATKKLSERLLDLPTPLQDGAAGVQQLVAAGLGIEEATDTFLAFNNATLAASTETGAAQGAFIQLTQAISKGKIEGQEWNSIVSAMPTAFQALSKESGKSREELRQLYRESPEKLLKDLVRLDKEGGGGLASLEEQARAATGGIGTAFANMNNAVTRGIESIVRSIGDGGTDQEKLESGQRKISDAITATGKAFGNALSAIGGAIRVFMDAVRAVIGWLQPLIDYVKNNQTVMDVLKTTLIVLAGILGGAIIAAIVIVVGTVALLTGVIDVLVKVFTWLMETAVNVWNTVSQWAVNAWNTISGVWSGVVNFFGGVFNGIVGFFSKLPGRIVSFFSAAWEWVKRVWSAATGWFGGIFNGIVGFFSRLPGRIRTFFQNAWNGVRGVWGGAAGWFSGIINGIFSFFSNVPSRIRGFFTNAFNAVKSINWVQLGADIISGVVNGLNPSSIVSKMKEIASSALDTVKAFLGIKSPSRVFMQVGKDITAGWAGGVQQGSGEVVGAVKSTSSRMLGAVDSFGSTVIPSNFGSMVSTPATTGGGGTTGNSVTVGTIIIEKDVDVDLVARKLGISQLQTRRGIA